jgi:hypothetical protein
MRHNLYMNGYNVKDVIGILIIKMLYHVNIGSNYRYFKLVI